MSSTDTDAIAISCMDGQTEAQMGGQEQGYSIAGYKNDNLN